MNRIWTVSYTHLDVYKRQELPSSIEGITKKLLLLYVGPYTITRDKGNNTYEITNPITKKIKGVYNQASIKKYYDSQT